MPAKPRKEFSLYRAEYKKEKAAGQTNEQLFDALQNKVVVNTKQHRGSAPDITNSSKINRGLSSDAIPKNHDGIQKAGTEHVMLNGNRASLRKANSDLNLSSEHNKRRRAIVFNNPKGGEGGDASSGKKHPINYMKASAAVAGPTSLSVNPIDSQDDLERKEAAALVMTALRKFFFLGGDVFDRMPLILASIVPERVLAGDMLIRRGDQGDKMYVIYSGELAVLNVDETSVKITLAHGSLVGEVALVYDEVRMASVRVVESGTLFSLSREKFKQLQEIASSSSIVKRCTYLHDVPCLRDISFFAISRVAQLVHRVELSVGETLLSEGDTTDRCYLLEEVGIEAVGGSKALEVSVSLDKTLEPQQCFVTALSSDVDSDQRLLDEVSSEQALRPATSPTSFDTEEQSSSDSSAGRKVYAVPGSFFGDGLLRAAVGAASTWGWSAVDGTGRCPVTIKNVGKSPVSLSYFTISEFKEWLGGELHLHIFTGDEVAPSGVVPKPRRTYEIADFEVLSFLGQGSFGSVKLVRTHVPEDDESLPVVYAMKSMSKMTVIESNQVDHSVDERNLLFMLQHPNVLRLFATFQTPDEVFLLTELIDGCDLWALIHSDAASTGRPAGLPPKFVKFYAACVAEALGHIHSKGIAYRDLKPENVMVDKEGYLKIIDFGFAKMIPYTTVVDAACPAQFMPKSFTMCGTPDYLAPEFITSEGHDHTADLWALGVMVHELVVSKSPFASDSLSALFTNIVTTLYTGVKFSREFKHDAGPQLLELVKGLCAFKTVDRLGGRSQGMDEVRQLPYFRDINFEDLVARKIKAPWKPDPDTLSEFREDEETRPPKKFAGDQALFKDF